MPPLAREILDFWFGPLPHAARAEWFRKDPAFDASIADPLRRRDRGRPGGAFRDWHSATRAALARVLLLDQFTRNAFRDTPRAFAGDAEALATAIAIVDAGGDRTLDAFERWFLYLPFEHAESPAMQQRSIALFTRLADDTGDRTPLEWAAKHAAVVRRFGRYPHRNAILGRTSTPGGNRVPAGTGVALLGPVPQRLQATIDLVMHPVLGVFGGTFDPIHCGHLELARELRAALGFSAVRFIPAGDPPHRAAPVATAAHRLAMVELAIAGHPDLQVDAREILRPGRSYTVPTLEELRSEEPSRPLALIVGADAFLGLPTWHRWRELFALAHVVVVGRPGVTIEDALPPGARRRVVAAPVSRRCGARPGSRRVGARASGHGASDLRVGDTRATRARRRRRRRGARFASGRGFGLY